MAGFITEYRPVYSKQLQVYKGIDNVLEFRLLNADQKPVDVTSYTPKFVAFDETNQMVLEKDATIQDDGSTVTRGKFKVTVTENELLNLKQQYLSIKILCDIPENIKITIIEPLQYNQQFSLGLTVNNQLQYKSSLLKVEQANVDIKINRFKQFPTLSFVYYDAWQQNSNIQFFDNNVDWINSQYLGLKLTMFFPDVNRYMLTQTSKINKTISLQNAEHSKIQNVLVNKQLVLDHEKAYSQVNSTQQIYELKEQNYQLALNQFNASILPSDKLLIAFNDLLVSRLNHCNAISNVLFTKSKIDINNKIK
jgi:outer membrane protein TolC